MRESRTYGSVRGAPSNGRPYRDCPMTADLLAVPGKEAELARQIPLRRICEPADVAAAVEALYRLTMTTAHVLPVDGGYLCR